MEKGRAQTLHSYDRLSGWYDFIAASENPYKDRALDLLELCPGERLLEIGSGTGRTLARAAGRLGATGLAAGIDLSPGMVAAARKKLARPALVNGDAAALPYQTGCFDAIFCAFTLELFSIDEIPIVLAECRRVLRSGGRMALVALSRPARPGLPVHVYEWFHQKYPGVVDCRPIPAARMLEANGFRVQSAEQPKMWGLPLEILVCM